MSVARFRLLPAALLLVIFTGGSLSAQEVIQEAAELPDGVHELLGDGEGTPHTLSDGRTVNRGELVTGNLGAAEMWSQTNDNQQFTLNLSNISGFPQDWEGGQLMIVAGELSLAAGSISSPQADRPAELQVNVAGAELAEQLAAQLQAEVHMREHPGHQILTTWTPLEESFRPGQSVRLKLEIKNVGDEPIRFYEGGQQRGYRDNQFRFIAMSQVGWGPGLPDTGDARNFGGIAELREIAPGESFTKEISLNEWFKLTEPGTYQITGLYEIQLYSAEDRHRPLWRDFAVGECQVRIQAAEESR